MSQKNTIDSRAQSEHFRRKILNLHLTVAEAGSHAIKRIHQVSTRYVRAQGYINGIVEQ